MSQLEENFRKAIEKERKAAEEASRLKGKYKIQIWFKSDRSMSKPIAFSLSAWQSGKRLHGGGDEMMFLCRRHATARSVAPFEVAAKIGNNYRAKPTKRGCGLFIPGENSVNGRILCPHCGTSHAAEEVGDAVFYRLTADKAAKVLVDWYYKLESCADLYAKYSPLDPRTIMMAQAYDPRVARQKKGLTIYPFHNIVTDISNGSTLENRFKAFILA